MCGLHRIKLYYLLKPDKNTRRQACIVHLYYVLACFATLTQIANPIIILFASEAEYERLVEEEFDYGHMFIVRNSLTTVATAIYTVYNLAFPCILAKEMQGNESLRG